MSDLAPADRLGILGGGQLGRMLGMAAARLGVATVVVDPDPGAPAAVTCGRHLCGDYADAGVLAELADAVDVVTYEFENVPVEAVNRLSEQVPVRPDAEALATAQDRLVEKRFLSGLGLAVAPFVPADSQDGIVAAVAGLGGNAILKTRRFGYDGKGQLRVANGLIPADAFAQLGSAPLVVEGVVDFVAEVSVIGARSSDGQVECFPPSANEHQDGILRRSVVPSGVGRDVEAQAVEAAERLLGALDYVGVLGLELFVTAAGEVVANEFAPRVHNSGHWTEAAGVLSQFEQHVRAATGRPLGQPGPVRPAQMVNLIGDEVEAATSLLAEPDVLLHLYGKGEVRPGRKMGHYTRLAQVSE